MGLDGFSMGSIGLNPELASAQAIGQTEFEAMKEGKIEVKSINKSADKDGIKEKDKDAHSEGQKEQENDENNPNQEELEKQEKLLSLEKESLKGYTMRVNTKNNTIELYNENENRVLDTIDADNLVKVMSKLNHAAGAFINKKV
ncbi:MAG: hypothetical protein MJ229_00905 [bacterium]|nr:hypothetical protein [bacterium]